jgi:hypothetical protein
MTRERIDRLSQTIRQIPVHPEGPLPEELMDALRELASLAQAEMKARRAQGTGDASASLANDCSEYNTWWNALKSIFGACDDWQKCMGYC